MMGAALGFVVAWNWLQLGRVRVSKQDLENSEIWKSESGLLASSGPDRTSKMQSSVKQCKHDAMQECFVDDAVCSIVALLDSLHQYDDSPVCHMAMSSQKSALARPS